MKLGPDLHLQKISKPSALVLAVHVHCRSWYMYMADDCCQISMYYHTIWYCLNAEYRKIKINQCDTHLFFFEFFVYQKKNSLSDSEIITINPFW